jgi:type I restriction enzyme R subunit
MRSLNFEYLRPNYAQLAVLGAFAEQYAHPDPASSLVKLRSFAESVVQFIYIKLSLPEPYGGGLHDLLQEASFAAAVPRVIQMKLDVLRRRGNKAAHGERASTEIALGCLKEAHDLGRWLVVQFNKFNPADLQDYQEPQPGGTVGASKGQLKREKKELLQQLNARQAELDALMAELAETRERAARLDSSPAELQQQLETGIEAAHELELSEAETRQRLIDDMLYDAGWHVPKSGSNSAVAVEFEVEHQPTNTGKGYADYVLWGDDGKPLGVVEAKKTANDARDGMNQARIYADGLEKMFGTRPVIFYTNGFDTYIWDDAQNQVPRRVWGFYSKDSLHQLHFQRTRSTPSAGIPPKTEIIDRLYQLEAVKRVTERFDQGHRRALIVLATGTGKTRLAIALTDVLLRANRVKRVLFLCDRLELRKQAIGAFKSHLPDASRIVVKSDTAHERNHQIYFATYPAMMKCLETFDVGFFDLIIADESHRSIYNKFRDIFLYLDALQVGLTATPIQFIERNTYGLFGCEDRDPTAHYSLAEAVEEDYLVPPRVQTFTTGFQRKGIKYVDLDEDQRRQLEEQLANAQAADYEAQDLDKHIFNKDTNRQILRNLMENGQRDTSGQRPGKSLVFARSHDHAVLLKGLFDEMYPQYGGKLCQVIDHYEKRAEQLIDDFKGQGQTNDITIAVSVDMLDTGIDVPEIVNLVFAKPIKSFVKFWQMIGRGTRLRRDLFGPGEDKKFFTVFDHWGNFQYFGESYVQPNPTPSRSLMQQLFEARVELASDALQKANMPAFEVLIDGIRDMLLGLEASGTIAVKERRKDIKGITEGQVLESFAPETRSKLTHDLAGLMRWIDVPYDDLAAYRFDLFVLEIQAEVVKPSGRIADLRGRLTATLDQLKMHLNQVRAKADAVARVRSDEFWDGVTFEALEEAREQLRSIMRFREAAAKPRNSPKIIDVKENRDTEENAEFAVRMDGLDQIAYRKRVEEVLDELFDEAPVLQKIKAGQPVTPLELSELAKLVLTRDPALRLERLTEDEETTAVNLEVAIRKVIGLDAEEVDRHFAVFLQGHAHLNAEQIQFLRLLKKQISRRGAVTLEELWEMPFTAFHPDGINGVFNDSAQVDAIIRIVEAFEHPPQPGD